LKAPPFSAGEARASHHNTRSGTEHTPHPLQSVDPAPFTASTSATRDVIAESPRLPPCYSLKAPARDPSSLKARHDSLEVQSDIVSSSRNPSKISITLGCSQAKAVNRARVRNDVLGPSQHSFSSSNPASQAHPPLKPSAPQALTRLQENPTQKAKKSMLP
jgi:hypothetical protein